MTEEIINAYECKRNDYWLDPSMEPLRRGFSTSWIRKAKRNTYDTRKTCSFMLCSWRVWSLIEGYSFHHKTQKWYFKVTLLLGTFSHLHTLRFMEVSMAVENHFLMYLGNGR